jgi:hypothetical protein
VPASDFTTLALAAQLFKRTGGNPLFVIELAQQALEEGDAADVASLQALLGARPKGCSAVAQQLAGSPAQGLRPDPLDRVEPDGSDYIDHCPHAHAR